EKEKEVPQEEFAEARPSKLKFLRGRNQIGAVCRGSSGRPQQGPQRTEINGRSGNRDEENRPITALNRHNIPRMADEGSSQYQLDCNCEHGSKTLARPAYKWFFNELKKTKDQENNLFVRFIYGRHKRQTGKEQQPEQIMPWRRRAFFCHSGNAMTLSQRGFSQTRGFASFNMALILAPSDC